MVKCFLWGILFFLLVTCGMKDTSDQKVPNKNPNIIIFYVDDLGYGDLSCYGAKGVETPNVDLLAREGIRFTDAHSAAATCTPSRYSLLTGEYAFRNNATVLPGDAPLLIDPDMPTLASMLKENEYKTGVVGKWHLGLGRGEVDWNKAVKPGPLELGFDYSFLLPATGDRVPCVYLENHEVVGLNEKNPLRISYEEKIGDPPTGTEHPEMLRQQADPQHSNTIINGISRIGYMAGGHEAEWVDEEFPEVFTEKAKTFIQSNSDQPFFLFFSFHDIHVPRLPHERFDGKSTMGPRGDAIVQMDWMTGEIMNELKKLKLSENTLVIFTSDNGPVLNDGYEDQAVELLGDHKPWGPFRGGKYSAYEAGTRVPTIVSWPGTIEPGESDALISQVDIYASVASIIGHKMRDQEAPDSYDLSEALLDHASEVERPSMLEESMSLSLRQGDWKYIEPFPENLPIPQWLKRKDIEGGLMYEPQLYNLANDIGEQNNLADEHPERVKAMQDAIDSIRSQSIN